MSLRRSAVIAVIALIAGCSPTHDRTTQGSAPQSPCRGHDLAVDFHSGQPSAGNDGATIIIRNVGTHACQLVGSVMVTGLDAARTPDTQTLRYDPVPGLLLTAGAHPIAEGHEIPRGIGVLLLMANHRDDPTSANGLCDAHHVTPVSWRLTWPDSISTTVTNLDTHPVFPDDATLMTCRGHLDTAVPITSGD
jgi:hypothetical protein